MIFITWNVRGINEPLKLKEVKRFLEGKQVNLVGLFETKVKNQFIQKKQNKFGTKWKWIDNSNKESHGRIWVRWNPDTVNFQVYQTHEQFIHGIATSKDQKHQIDISFVYGLHTVQHRRALCKEMGKLAGIGLPWLISGDFNAVLYPEDRIKGNHVSTYETSDFQQFLVDVELTEIQSKGHFYSWSNNTVCSRIDRGLVNDSWVFKYD